MIAVLIPAFEPDAKLVRLIESIRASAAALPVVIVDDGSGPEHARVFEIAASLGCDVITHPYNRGKGAALKRGFAHVADRYPQHDVVCADCDGQHDVADIFRVAAALQSHHSAIILGTRQFGGDVPVRSRIGNGLTRIVFRLTTRTELDDTQTGLRGYPAWLVGWLRDIPGERFDYELEVLLAARRCGIELHELPIQTIYIAGNESSHFDPIRDSVRVYIPFVKFSASSLTAFAIDTALFFVLFAATGRLALAVVVARVASGTVNFVTNRRLVFAGGDRRTLLTAGRYAGLAGVLLVANYAALRTLVDDLAMPVVAAKLPTEVILFVASYQCQKRFVFRRRRVGRPAAVIDSQLAGDAQPSVERAKVG